MDAKTLCLSLLSLGEASGYEIRKQLVEGPVGLFHGASYGSIYPALAKLSAEGLVTAETHGQEGKPDKKVYRITPAGMAALKRALMGEAAYDKIRSEYLLLLFFSDLLPPERVSELLKAYLDRHREIISMLTAENSEPETPGQRFVHEFGLAVYRARLNFLEENVEALIESLSAPERKIGSPDEIQAAE